MSCIISNHLGSQGRSTERGVESRGRGQLAKSGLAGWQGWWRQRGEQAETGAR